jgi:hypothetical protein
VVDGLKVLDPERPIREADKRGGFCNVGFVLLATSHASLEMKEAANRSGLFVELGRYAGATLAYTCVKVIQFLLVGRISSLQSCHYLITVLSERSQ